MKLSIVIPCYNEAENIPLLINSIKAEFKPNTEIILIDNGSTDDTTNILSNELKSIKNDSIRLIRVEKNIGYGHGIMAGIKEAKGDIIAWTHADLQTDIKDVYNGYEIFDSKSNQKKTFLKGFRKERSLINQILTWGMAKISSVVLGEKLTEINAQPKMFHRSFLELAAEPPDDFSLDLYFYFMAVKNEFNVMELPVYFKDRLYGEAKGGGGSSVFTRIKVIKRTLKYIYQLKNNI
jgi:dolichol-phosphate mannosyltransferase